ncbi:OmpA family protein [Pedobacter sp. ASV12]|uniref:OmpA family protein n=1 Tax=Pedobacter sp. ASV12 TaxID=2795120 RepID=UPI0018EC84E3|nr:OmpA family protein [Pedobacter sp. ASV12]
MTRTSRLNLILLIALLLCTSIGAKAQYILKEADAAYELFNYAKAIDLYEQAYQKRQSLHAAERLAECYELTNNYKEFESWAAIAANMEVSSPENTLRYAKALQHNLKYNEAKLQYQKYLQLNGKVPATQKSLWLLSCDSAMLWMKNPKSTAIVNQKQLNSPQSDWGVVKLASALVFASDRANPEDTLAQSASRKPFLKFDGAQQPSKTIYGWTGNHYYKLYEQNGTTVAFFKAPFGTDYHVGPASFTADDNEMFFTLTRIPKNPEFMKGKLATVNLEIYSSQKDANGNWKAPVSFPYNNVNQYSLGDPFISKDGSILYFSANLPGGKGGLDLYASFRTENGGWGKPINLEEFNTEGNERTPFFDGDETFYFSSDGWIGMGGLDIFKSVRRSGKMSKPVNMGYPVNSPQDDFAYSKAGELDGYLSSNRIGGLGNDDIYGFAEQLILAFKLNGIAYDKKTRLPLGNVVVSLNGANGNSLKVQTEADGKFSFSLEKETDYTLTGDKTNFRSDNASLSTKNLLASTVWKQDLFLEQIELNKGIRLENIYYDFDKSNIRPDAAIELDKLVKIMQDNPTIWIELGSHTDSRGNSQYNQWLSQSRANAAVQYIIDRGIAKNRISAKGYGESQLLNRCAKGVKCTEAEHQLNRRTEFKIVKQ